MWKRVSNSNSVKPAEIDETSSRKYVYVRKRFTLISVSHDGETAEHWEYDEWKMTKEQYEIYKVFSTQVSEQQDALIELAGLIAEVM